MNRQEISVMSFESTAAPPLHRRRTEIWAAFPLGALVALASLGGILIPSLYSRESPNWAAQAVGQDWVDLVMAVPWLIVTGTLALRGSTRGLLLLAGGLLYTLYTFVLYALGMHFNLMFLVYCGALGVSFFALTGAYVQLKEKGIAYVESVATRIAGYFLVTIGGLFGLVWLSEVVPAIVSNTTPASIVETGTPTNPVYVIDLSVILPLHIAAGVALLRRRPFGALLAPVVLAFGVLMALSIAGMMVVMRLRGVDANLGVVAAMAVVSLASAAVLAALLRNMKPS